MQALAEFAEKAYGNNTDFRSSQLSGSLKMGNYYNHDFVITKDNKLTLQTVELPTKIIPGKLEISGQGVGCAFIQVNVSLQCTYERACNVPTPLKLGNTSGKTKFFGFLNLLKCYMCYTCNFATISNAITVEVESGHNSSTQRILNFSIRPLNMPNNALLMYKIKQRRQGNHKYIRMKQVYKELKCFFFMPLGLSIL